MNSSINIRFIYGNNNYNLSLNPSDTIGELKNKILDSLMMDSESGVSLGKYNSESVSIKMGFPPVTIEVDENNDKSLSDMKISNNEQLRVELKEGAVNNTLQKESNTYSDKNTNLPSNKTNHDPIDYSKYSLFRKVIAADNSCLFNGINYAMNQCLDAPAILRELIAVEIQSNPDIYNEAILDKDPFEYSAWIMRDDTWGGGIELSILSKCFQTRLAVCDIRNGNIEYFGENYPSVIYLLYDGIHYDVFVRRENDGSENGVFLATDDKAKYDVLDILKELKKLSKFVDTATYKIKCNVCYELLKGNDDVMNHSKKTGHINFVQL